MTHPIPLDYGKFYHIYNRGNNRENVFIEERNYAYFLKLYTHYIQPIADTFAYCLLHNHFHLLVRIKDLTGFEDLSGLKETSQYFSNLFNAYAKAINKAYQRTGALFQRPFGRIEVTSEAYFLVLVAYIHQNPQRHGFVEDFRSWPHSSYETLLSNKPTRLKREEVLTWYRGVKYLEEFHRREVKDSEIAQFLPEDGD